MLFNTLQKYLSICALALIPPSLAFAAPPAAPQKIKVVKLNVLAPAWSALRWYPYGCPEKLDRYVRRGHLIEVLNSLKSDVDFFSLQENTN